MFVALTSGHVEISVISVSGYSVMLVGVSVCVDMQTVCNMRLLGLIILSGDFIRLIFL